MNMDRLCDKTVTIIDDLAIVPAGMMDIAVGIVFAEKGFIVLIM